MPIIRVELLPGRSLEQKVQYAAEVTRLTVELLQCPAPSVDVIFTEVAPTDWAKEGRMLSMPHDKP